TQGRAMRLLAGLSLTGLVLGTLFFSASLAPSLLPRGFALQGVLSGCSFAAGYGVGVFLAWLWTYLELPVLAPPRLAVAQRIGLAACLLAAAIFLWRASDFQASVRVLMGLAPLGGDRPGEAATTGALLLAACLLAAAIFLWRASDFQDSVRVLMGLAPLGGDRPVEVAIIAALVFAAILALARVLAALLGLVARWSGRLVPRRIANAIGAAVVIFLFWTAIDGLLFKGALRAADASFRRFDALIEPDVEKPAAPDRTGSLASRRSEARR